MKQLGVLLVVLSVPVSAHADIAPSGALSVGANLGGNNHSDGANATIGGLFDADLRFGIFTVGGSLGLDAYSVMDHAPLHASTYAARAGIALPVSNAPKRTVSIDLIGSVEAGVHHYSVDGDRHEFLGPTVSYTGQDAAIGFGGLRAGAEMTIRRAGSSAGVQLKLELIGRHDVRTTELAYNRVSCGGLFLDSNDCSASQGAIGVGGTEVGFTTSIGVQFGGP